MSQQTEQMSQQTNEACTVASSDQTSCCIRRTKHPNEQLELETVGGQCESNLDEPSPPLSLTLHVEDVHAEADREAVEGLLGVVVGDDDAIASLGDMPDMEHLPKRLAQQGGRARRLRLVRGPERNGAAHQVLTRAPGGATPHAGLAEKTVAAW